ncbi:MAG TPA: PQQ-dependent sugar dehydrogenase [Phycisphaeraceae bacterium]
MSHTPSVEDIVMLYSTIRYGLAMLVMGAPVAAWAQAITNPFPDPIPKGSVAIELQTIASGFSAPNYLTSARDGSGRLFVVDQTGQVRVINAQGDLLPTPFLDLGPSGLNRLVNLRSGFDERGLLGLAFHPGFNDPSSPGYRKVYTYNSEPVAGAADFTVPLPAGVSFDHQSVITEWQVDASNPNVIDPTTRREVMRIDEPQFNHNAGMIDFGPDGYLYIALGDGGAGDDEGNGHSPGGNGQDTSNVLGTILRINPLDPGLTSTSSDPVSANGKYRVAGDNPFVGSDGVDEIYAYGFRNPFRFSFDVNPATGLATGGTTGKLLVGDAGQNVVEEVDDVVKGGNYGWRLKEGSFKFDPNGTGPGFITADTSGLPPDLIDPILEYDHFREMTDTGVVPEGLAVIGGFIYRGSAIPELVGKYIFGDFTQSFGTPTGRLFYADLDTGEIQELIIGLDDRALGLYLKGFGRDTEGEIYVLAGTTAGPTGTGSMVLKIVPVPEPAAAAVLLLAAGWMGMMRQRPTRRQG